MGFRILRREEIDATPEELGIEVVTSRRATDGEIGVLYREAKERSGIYHPDLEKYLEAADKLGRVAIFTDRPEELEEVERVLSDSTR